jgi:phage gp29-like protein
MGMEIDLDQAHNMLQIPRAKEGAKILNIGGQVNQKTALRASLTNQRIQPETISDNIANQLTELSMTYEQAQQEMIAALVAEAGDIESAIAQVGALNLNKSPIYKEWVDLITKGMVAANLAGRAEATHE